MGKKVFVLNGSPYEENIIRIFKQMGHTVITSGNVAGFPGHRLADRYICHDYSDREGMLRIAQEEAIDYVCACANDFGVLTAAYIAEEMGLPGHDRYETAKIIAQKDLFKAFAQGNDLQVIPSRGFSELDEAIAYAEAAVYPIIVKPVDLTGGKGVSKAVDRESAKQAVIHAFERSRAKRIVIEPYISGTQHSITTFLIDQKVAAYGTFNEGDANNAFLVGKTTCPADCEAATKDILIGQIEKIASLLNLRDGIFHVQYRMDGNKPLIMEAMRRILGNRCLESLKKSTGVDWEFWQASYYCGNDCSRIAETVHPPIPCSEYYIQAPSNGVIKALYISPELDIYKAGLYEQWYPGQIIADYQTEKLAFLFLEFPDIFTRDRIHSNIDRYIQVVMG